MIINHKCLVCGVEYQYCDDCKKMKEHFTPWKTICDTQQHFQVYSLFKELKAKRISNIEAKFQLDNIGVNVDDVNTFNDSVKEILLPIFLSVFTPVSEQEINLDSEIENGFAESVEEDTNDEESESQSEYSYSKRNKKRK